MGAVLLLSGLVAAVLGTWRGYASAREAVGPFAHRGDETRSLIDASRPLHARSRVRRLVRSAALACAWLLVALYGLYLWTVGLGLAG
jgi:hypothetical protein